MTFGTFELATVTDSLILSMATGDATAAQVAFFLEMKTPAQAWGDVSAVNFPVTPTGGSATVEIRLPRNMRSFDLRARVRDNDTLTYTSYREATYTDGSAAVDAVVQPNARTVSYKTARDKLIARHGITAPTATDYAQCAEFLGSAYRSCLEEWKWQEALLSDTVDITDGLVTWADLQGADCYEFWTVNPLAESTRDTAEPVQTRGATAAGVYLDLAGRSLTEVWVQFMRRAPVFSATVLDSGTSYGLGTVGYVDTTGHCYECLDEDGALGSEIDNGLKWRALPLLWKLLEPTLDRAEAHFFSRSQERGQASSLRNSAEAHIDRLCRTEPSQ